MTLLSVVQNAMTLVNLPVPSTAYASTDQMVKQMVRMVYIVGRDLLDRHDWNALLVTQTLTSTGSNAQTGYPVAAFHRMANGTDVWNATSRWPVHGPVNSEEWSDLITRASVGWPQYWRIITNVLNIYAPHSGDTIRYEYVSKYWILQGGTVAGSTLTADTDTFNYPENLMELALAWRWKQSKQLDYAEDMRTYEIALLDAIRRDKGGRRVITTSRATVERPYKTWPGTVTPV